MSRQSTHENEAVTACVPGATCRQCHDTGRRHLELTLLYCLISCSTSVVPDPTSDPASHLRRIEHQAGGGLTEVVLQEVRGADVGAQLGRPDGADDIAEILRRLGQPRQPPVHASQHRLRHRTPNRSRRAWRRQVTGCASTWAGMPVRREDYVKKKFAAEEVSTSGATVSHWATAACGQSSTGMHSVDYCVQCRHVPLGRRKDTDRAARRQAARRLAAPAPPRTPAPSPHTPEAGTPPVACRKVCRNEP